MSEKNEKKPPVCETADSRENGAVVSKKIRTLHIVLTVVFIALILLTLYCVYGLAGTLYGWLNQPLFHGPGGAASRSYGFFVVAMVFACLIVLLTAVDILYGILVLKRFYKKYISVRSAELTRT
ncbi:MAG: hypothetical protein LBH24_01225 [Clostridiales bacterium]|jgi:ABC-type transport system involved in cytochrome c biogenesis permease subunit|nr:hypothetical protein [Clostridiales bacterium]